MTDKDKQKKAFRYGHLDPIAKFILDFLESVKDNEPVSKERLAKAFWELRKREKDDKDTWRKYLNSTKQQAIFLARKDIIEITRRGKVVDPNDFKGLVRLRIKK